LSLNDIFKLPCITVKGETAQAVANNLLNLLGRKLICIHRTMTSSRFSMS